MMRLLANVESFVEVARSLNFSKAARVLGVMPSTLSRRIGLLERELGTVLIRRSTRSLSLTPSGQSFLERSRELFEQSARIKEEFRADFARVDGHLRIGAPSDLAMTLLAPVFASYCRTHEGISIDIIATQGQPDLIGDRLDVAFVVAHQARLSNSSLSVRHIGSFSRKLYASTPYLQQTCVPDTPQDLSNHHCIRYLDTSPEKAWDLHRGRKRQTVVVRGVCCSSSVVASAHAAREHLGIVLLPQYLACHPAYGAGLACVLPDWEGTPATVFAVTAARAVSARIDGLIREAKAQFAGRLADLESSAG